MTDRRDNYLTRAARALKNTFSLLREGRIGEALVFLRRKLWTVSDTVVFERRAGEANPEQDIPGLKIQTVERRDAEAHRAAIAKIEAGWDVQNFEGGATCYLAYLDGEPAGVGWRFPTSRLLVRIGYPPTAVYAGGFHVREEFRGRGLYPAMLRALCRDVRPAEALVVVEAGLANRASHRGLVKAGFRVVGRLRTRVIAGMIVRWSLEPWTSLS